MNDVRNYMSELNSKDAMIKELKMELESSHFLSMQLKLENEELSIMLLVLKLGISEAQTEVGRYKEMLEGLSKNELCFDYQVFQVEVEEAIKQ
ncbi:hypothetical protein ACFX15_018479 [Malus domestica]